MKSFLLKDIFAAASFYKTANNIYYSSGSKSNTMSLFFLSYQLNFCANTV